MALTASGNKNVIGLALPIVLTSAEALEKGDLVTYDGYKADANNSRKAEYVCGATVNSASVNFVAFSEAILDGEASVSAPYGGTAGATLYLSDTAGDYAESAGTATEIVGRQISATRSHLFPRKQLVTNTFGDAETMTFGTGSDVVMQFDGTSFIIAAGTDDLVFEIGDAAATQKSFDVKIYGNAASGAEYITFDGGASKLITTGYDIQFKDNDILSFGTDSDVTITYDNTSLIVAAAADNAVIEIGDAAASQKSFDVKIYGNAASGAEYVTFDAGSSCVITTGYDIQLKDADILSFGTGAGKAGDINLHFDDATGLQLFTVASDENLVIGKTSASNRVNTTIFGTVTVGVDNTGHDVIFYGATASKKLHWDESEDQLDIHGVLNLADQTITTAAASGSADLSDWCDSFNGANGGADEDVKYCLTMEVSGTTYYVPAFTSV